MESLVIWQMMALILGRTSIGTLCASKMAEFKS